MAKKKAKASKNEKAAAKAGVSLKEYKASKGSSSKSSSSDKSAKKQIKKYYGEEEEQVKKKAETDTKRLQEDLASIMRDAGITSTRATEDYIRNIGNIQANKAADVADINDYVKTNTGRTQEDLDTSLAKESRRYALESDKINQDLADSGLTFSERTPEKVAAAGTAETQAGIQTEANRSFQDIARYEAVKNRDVELKYGQQTEEATTTKTRTLEDVLNEQADKAQKIQRGQEDVAFGKASDIRDISYNKDTALYNVDLNTAQQANNLQNEILKNEVTG
jgi:hypothetical protein